MQSLQLVREIGIRFPAACCAILAKRSISTSIRLGNEVGAVDCVQGLADIRRLAAIAKRHLELPTLIPSIPRRFSPVDDILAGMQIPV